MTKAKTKGPVMDEGWIAEVLRRLEKDEAISRPLPGGGHLHIERRVPFLLVFRAGGQDSDETARFVRAHPSYLVIQKGMGRKRPTGELVRRLAQNLARGLGSFLLVEIWAGSALRQEGPAQSPVPAFRVHTLQGTCSDRLLESIESRLGAIRVAGRSASVTTTSEKRVAAPGRVPLVSAEEAQRIGCQVVGLEIAPIYRGTADTVFPVVLRALKRELTRSLRKVFFDFSVDETSHRPPHFNALGRRAVNKAVWEADRRIAAVCDQFEFLMLVTPINAEEAWWRFRSSKYKRIPSFLYRPLPAEPIVLKRDLYRSPVERVNDPALAQLFREKLAEVDRQVTMLQDRNTRRFLPGSIQLYGGVNAQLLRTARKIIHEIGPSAHRSESGERLDANAFAKRARAEIAFLKRQFPDLTSTVEVRSDIASLMVSRGNLLVGKEWRVPKSRVDALLQHEIGTHVVTYFNGNAQPFRQLQAGLAGYEALQEGLAVLAEFLVGGLSRSRLRLLAARVLAVHALIDGADFVECFKLLRTDHGLPARTAFNVTLRVYRGGGLTKDAVYLAGLVQVLNYLRQGGDLDDLLIGKIAANHVDIVRELLWRKVLSPAPLRPRYLDRPDAQARLERVRESRTVLDLIHRKKKP